MKYINMLIMYFKVPYYFIQEPKQHIQYNDSTGWMAEESGFNSQWGQDIFLFSAASRLVWGPPSILSIVFQG
jgi:hypothetical protein